MLHGHVKFCANSVQNTEDARTILKMKIRINKNKKQTICVD